MSKKIIIKNILKVVPLFVGLILCTTKTYSQIGIIFLFAGGYIIIKNLVDYRQRNKTIKEFQNFKKISPKTINHSNTLSKDKILNKKNEHPITQKILPKQEIYNKTIPKTKTRKR